MKKQKIEVVRASYSGILPTCIVGKDIQDFLVQLLRDYKEDYGEKYALYAWELLQRSHIIFEEDFPVARKITKTALFFSPVRSVRLRVWNHPAFWRSLLAHEIHHLVIADMFGHDQYHNHWNAADWNREDSYSQREKLYD